MVNDMITYGSKIRKYRTEKGYTQEFMANQLGISQNAYHKIESGQTQIKAQTLEQIADILEVDRLKLMSDENNKYKIRQKSYEQSTGVQINENNFEEERKVWQVLEKSLSKTIEIQEQLIEFLQNKIIDLERK